MMILNDLRIESPWNWESQSRPVVCFNGLRDAYGRQHPSSNHPNYRLKAHKNLVGLHPTSQLQVLRFPASIHRHISMPIRQAVVERFSPIHF